MLTITGTLDHGVLLVSGLELQLAEDEKSGINDLVMQARCRKKALSTTVLLKTDRTLSQELSNPPSSTPSAGHETRSYTGEHLSCSDTT